MTYASEHAKLFGATGLFLYEFVLDGVTYRFAARGTDYTGTDPVAATWTSEAIAHSTLRRTSASGRAELSITFPASNSFAQAVRDWEGYTECTVLIYHKYLTDPDDESVVKFRGRVMGRKPLWGTITLQCENRFTRRRQRGRWKVMQRPCPLAIYSPLCGVNIASFNTTGTATALSGLDVTVAAASGQADGYYTGGVFTYGTYKQTIANHVGSTLTLMSPVPGLADAVAGSPAPSVDIAPGCDKTRATCNSRFSNILNYGGFWDMTGSPYDGRNPF